MIPKGSSRSGPVEAGGWTEIQGRSRHWLTIFRGLLIATCWSMKVGGGAINNPYIYLIYNCIYEDLINCFQL